MSTRAIPVRLVEVNPHPGLDWAAVAAGAAAVLALVLILTGAALAAGHSRTQGGTMLKSWLRRRARLRSILVIATAATVAFAIGAGASPPSDLQAAKAASAKYHSLAQAKKDGYVRSSPCVSSPDGAMGIHYLSPQLASDTVVDPEHPELLLYLPDAHGKLKLVGVEYFVAAADQDPPIDNADTPHIFGRAFDGPMEGHDPTMPYHYDIHVWFWADNPSGEFAPFNPSLSCPQ